MRVGPEAASWSCAVVDSITEGDDIEFSNEGFCAAALDDGSAAGVDEVLATDGLACFHALYALKSTGVPFFLL